MKSFRVAILGCGTVGGGVARILLDLGKQIAQRSEANIEIAKIADIFPAKSAQRHGIPRELFCGTADELTKEESNKFIQEIIADPTIDLVVETIGGTSQFLLDIMLNVLKAKKHLVTANKAMLAHHGDEIFAAAEANGVSVGFEASVCGAIPIIKTVRECFTGDKINSVCGIMNGTSNYILSKMKAEGLSFADALALAQKHGYAEADPSLDINGGDAGHKLAILCRLAFGLAIKFEDLSVTGIENITKEDHDFASEMDATIKLICYAKNDGDKVYACVHPMIVRNENLLSDINGATNAVLLQNEYSTEHVLIGKGAGSLETGSAIVGDIVFISKYAECISNKQNIANVKLANVDDMEFPYMAIFGTNNTPGITGAITTAIGAQNINIDTVGHNYHTNGATTFTVTTMPCKLSQLKAAIAQIKAERADILVGTPKILPVLY